MCLECQDNAPWPGGFYSGQKVIGKGGIGCGLFGVVVSVAYCLGRDESQKGKAFRNLGIKKGLCLKFNRIGVFWCHPCQVKIQQG